MALKPSAKANSKLQLILKAYAGWEGGTAIESTSNRVHLKISETSRDSGNPAVLELNARLSNYQTSVLVSGNIFLPDESLTLWFNLPDGTIKGLEQLSLKADQTGLSVMSII